MSFTKVAPAGIGTEPGTSILIGDSLLHSTGIDIGSNTGIGVTIRKHGDATFTGIITASAFFGDGSGLEGVSSSGIGTPLSDDDTSELNKVYYVNQELSIGSTVTVNHPDSAIASYTHYQDLVVKDNADFIVSDGDTFIPDVLGINTASLPNPVSGATGGRIRAGTITNAGANGAPNFPNGLTGTAGTFTGNLNVGGVLTYEDVTNVDAIGIITARSGINVSGGNVKIGTTTEGHAEGDDLTIATSGVTGMTIRSGTGSAGNIFFSDATSGSAERQGIIRYDHADDAMKFNVNNAERIRIDNDGRLLIGTTTEGHAAGDDLTIAGSGNQGITIRSGTSNNGVIYFSDGTSGADEYRGAVQYNHTDNYLRFYTNGAEKFRIDSSGNVTKTAQPSFHVGSPNLAGGSSSEVWRCHANAIYSNIGSHYNNSNGRFTAPVAGQYFFFHWGMSNTSGQTCDVYSRKNGSRDQIGTSYNQPSGAGHDQFGCSYVRTLAAGDYVDVYTSNGNVYNTTDGRHGGWGGWLIG